MRKSLSRAVVASVFLLSCGTIFGSSTYNFDLEPNKEVEVTVKAGNEKKSIKIKNSSGSISIRGDETAENITISASIAGDDEGYVLDVTPYSDAVHMSVRNTNSQQNSSQTYRSRNRVIIVMNSSGGGNDTPVDITVVVPRSHLNNIIIDTENANVSLESLTDVGRIDVDGESSTVTVGEVNAANYDIDVGSGRVTFIRSSGDADVDTGSGRTEFTDFRGSIEVDSGSGGMSAENTRGNISVNTGSGSVVINRNVGDSIQAQTRNGAITVTNQEGGNIRLTTQDGARVITDNPLAAHQVVATPAPRNVQDRSGIWTQNIERISSSSSSSSSHGGIVVSGSNQVVINGRVVTGEEAERVQAQVMASFAHAFGGSFLGWQ